MTITVTAEDIRNGKRRSSAKCPVALAASRAFGQPVGAYGGFLCFDLGNVTVHRHSILPAEISRWMARFDAGQPEISLLVPPVEPITFEVIPPVAR